MIDELVLRERIFERLRSRAEQSGGFLTRDELSAFDLGDGSSRRLIDTSKGIWNPHDLVATLSIVSSPDGPMMIRSSAVESSGMPTAQAARRVTTPNCAEPASWDCP